MPAAPIASALQQTGVWDGHELLIAERVHVNKAPFCKDTAAAYRAADRTWRKLSPPQGPVGCLEGGDRSVWTGREMLLWGQTNMAFNPATNRWRKLPPPPTGAGGPAVTVWTGRQMIGWGGGCCGGAIADGAAYAPATNSWKMLPAAPLAARPNAVGAWTGTEMIVTGGETDQGRFFADAAAYNPATRTWRTLPPMPTSRTEATAVWDGTEVLVIGGWHVVGDRDVWLARGVAFNPTSNRWRWLPPMAFPRQGHVAVWSDHQLLVWGGAAYGRPGAGKVPPHGEAYDPATNTWSPLPAAPLRGRINPIAVWTGAAMLVWGGQSPGYHPFADGAGLTPGSA